MESTDNALVCRFFLSLSEENLYLFENTPIDELS